MKQRPARRDRAGVPTCRHARGCGRAGRARPTLGRAGYSLAEFLVCAALLMAAASFALVQTRPARRAVLLEGGARQLALAFRAARADAVRQGRSVAVQFLPEEEGLPFRMVADGNGNGVRRAEIAKGIDPALSAVRRIGDDHPGVRLGVAGPCPGIDGDGTLDEASAGVQFGESAMAVFTANGTSSSGTAYVTDGRSTYAVRVLGATGRTRVLRFDEGQRAWVAP